MLVMDIDGLLTGWLRGKTTPESRVGCEFFGCAREPPRNRGERGSGDDNDGGNGER